MTRRREEQLRAKRAVITDPAHVGTAKVLRREHAQRRDADSNGASQNTGSAAVAILSRPRERMVVATGDLLGERPDRANASRRATTVIATIRGLLLDLLATDDHERVQDAAEHFPASLHP